MKIKTVLLTMIVYSVLFIFLPLFFAQINKSLGLPVYSLGVLKTVGVILFIGAVGVISHCFEVFIKLGRGTPAPTDPPQVLVVQGIYKYTRNPMYIAYILIWCGEFLIFGQLLLAMYAFIQTIIFYLGVVFIEEKYLGDRFGQLYHDYCAKVPRWLIGSVNLPLRPGTPRRLS